MADTTVKVNFVGDAKDLNKAIDDVDKKVGGFSSSLGSLAKVGGALAATGLVAGLGSAAAAFAEDEKAATSLKTTLQNVTGATDDQVASVEKFINKTQNATGVLDDQLRPAFDSLVRGTGDLSKSQTLLGLAMDISAGTGKDLGSVTDALSKAYNGNMKALKALDPSITGLIKDGASADEVFDKLGQTFEGQTAAAADTASGKLAIAKARLSDLQEEVGAKVVPVLATLADIAATKVVPAIEKVVKIVSKVVTFLNDHREVAIGLAIAVATVLVPAFIAWATAAGAAAAATIAAAAPVIAIGVAIGALVAGIIWAYRNWGWFHDAVDAVASFLTDKLWPAIQTIVTWLADHLGPIIQDVAGFVTDDLVPAFMAVVGFIRDEVIPRIAAVIGVFADLIEKVIEVHAAVIGKFIEIVQFVAGLPGKVADAAKGIWDGIQQGIEAVVQYVLDQLDKLLGPLDEILGKVESVLQKTGLIGKGHALSDAIANGDTGKRAAGGPVRAGGTYLVGERGPELLTMGASGFVTPNHRIGGSSSPIVVVVEFDGRQVAQTVIDQSNTSGGLPIRIRAAS